MITESDLPGMVADYRIDHDCVVRNQLIVYHIPMVRKLLRRYMSRRWSYDDLLEVGQYELVLAVNAAADRLTDNNITPYILTRVMKRVLTHIIYEPAVTVPFNSQAARKYGMPHRQHLEDYESCNDCGLKLETKELIEKSTCGVQRQIVLMKLAGYIYTEIADQLQLSKSSVFRYWQDFLVTYKEEL